MRKSDQTNDEIALLNIDLHSKSGNKSNQNPIAQSVKNRLVEKTVLTQFRWWNLLFLPEVVAYELPPDEGTVKLLLILHISLIG